MKKAIFIIILLLIVGAAVGLCLYFFVFKSNSLTDEQAGNLVIRMAIDADAIEDYEGAPTFNYDAGAGKNNIINKDLKSIDGIVSSFTSTSINSSNDDYISGKTKFKDILSLCASFFKKDVKKGKVYSFTHKSTDYVITFDVIEYEILVTIKNEMSCSLVSFFYNATYNEYECILVDSGEDKFELNRFKSNSDGIISYEFYSLSDIIDTDTLAGIDSGEGKTSILLIDYVNGLQKKKTLTKTTSPDNHYLVSTYIYTASLNYSTAAKDQIDLIDKTETPIDLIDKAEDPIVLD